MREMAKQTKEDIHEARGTIMVLGEEIGVHLPRHVQAFYRVPVQLQKR